MKKTVNHEDIIVYNVGAYIQEFVNIISTVFGAKINYTGFEYFEVGDQGKNFRLTLKLNEYTTIVADTVDKNIDSWVVTIGSKQKGKSSLKLKSYIVSLFDYLTGEFGENIRSVTFTMEQGKPSSCNLCMGTDGEFDIVWAIIRPSGFLSYLEELDVNKFHYKHLLLKEDSNTPLLFGEAYYLALKHYNDGGDGFVECTDPKDFDRQKTEGKIFTKKKMLKDFKLYKSICEDRKGW